MRIDELIGNLEAQQNKTRIEIDHLKKTLDDREEYLVKLIGGVEALTIFKDHEFLPNEQEG